MKNLVGALILLVLIVVAIFIYQNQNGESYFENSNDFKDFAIEDTASIDQVFLSQPNGKKVLISRRGYDEWMVDGKYAARKDAIFLILKTAHDIKIQAPVSKTTFAGVVKRLATGSTKVEYYKNNEKKPFKVWYVGDATASRMGTYMLLEKEGEKSSKPYITHMLMERGFLGPRYIVDPNLWRDHLFLKLNAKDIKSLKLIHTNDTLTSFEITQTKDSEFTIKDLDNNKVEELSAEVAIPYLKLFQKVHYEYWDQKTPKETIDSIYQSPYRHSAEIMMKDGSRHSFQTYFMPVAEGATLNGETVYFHPERMYARSSYLGDEFDVIVQNYHFNPLLIDFKKLTESTTVEK
mgnify:CR=1 FL=1|tara:strand:- start:279 stop:1325 length:1047 start_codon:yes stop_codon:yes gene_type:complete